MHRNTPANSIFDGPVTTLLPMPYTLVDIMVSRAHAKREEKSLNGLKSGTSIGRFSSDGAENTAVKGLRLRYLVQCAGSRSPLKEMCCCSLSFTLVLIPPTGRASRLR